MIETLDAFERWVADTRPKLPNDQAERRLGRRLGSTRPMSVNDMLDVASQAYERRMAEDRIPIKREASLFVFLPSEGYRPIQPGPEPQSAFETPRIEARTRRFLAALTKPGSGVFIDDIVVHTGMVQAGAMRTEAYSLIQLPRHDREVLICDQVGNASFVGHGIRGPIFWATYRKDQLAQFKDITRVVNGPHSNARLIDLILHDNAPKPKALVSANRGLPLTEDLILIHALGYAETHGGKLPSQMRGNIDGLPNETWNAWQSAIRHPLRSLSREGVKGLSHLFQIYGLKNGNSENPVAITNAIKRLKQFGHHGLTAQNLNVADLSEDVILTHALYYAKKHGGQLPNQKTGDVDGLPGETWNGFNQGLRECYRGLSRAGIKSLNHLFQIYGLKNGKNENPIAIANAVNRLEKTGYHGLTAQGLDAASLSEDAILIHALRYAEKHNGQLPNQKTGDIDSLPGQTWKGFDKALSFQLRGLNRKNIRGLGHFYQIYGLKSGYTENQKTIADAISFLNTTGKHGLVSKDLDTEQLSENSILIKALRYAEKYDGKLPTRRSGAIDELSGQTWRSFDHIIRNGSSKSIRKHLKGLTHLFNLYGLKIGSRDQSEVIIKAIKGLNETKHHGLRSVINIGLPRPDIAAESASTTP